MGEILLFPYYTDKIFPPVYILFHQVKRPQTYF